MNQNLLLKYISGKASQREKEEVAAWIDADAANLKEFMSLRKSYDALVWQDADELKTGRDKLLSLRTFTMNADCGYICFGFRIKLCADTSPAKGKCRNADRICACRTTYASDAC